MYVIGKPESRSGLIAGLVWGHLDLVLFERPLTLLLCLLFINKLDNSFLDCAAGWIACREYLEHRLSVKGPLMSRRLQDLLRINKRSLLSRLLSNVMVDNGDVWLCSQRYLSSCIMHKRTDAGLLGSVQNLGS
jgi:hypothetical protein